ncbi:MAG: hypothetical protein PHQ53_00980 [Candidatus Krumholzibacteria bacterium]|nr:hypothetical protein [Candidatus Krumholzibacteria bacterium]
MTTTNNPHRVQRTMTILALGVILTAAAAVRAADTDDGRHSRDRKGWLVGMSAGWGHSLYSEKGGDRTITDDPYNGGFGGLRAGYAFSDAFAVTLEGYGFGSSAGTNNWGMGAGLLTVTWWPRGGGFFARLGAGSGGGEILLRETDEVVSFHEKATGLFGVGYEWQLNRRLAISLAADGFSFDLDGATSAKDDVAGAGGVSIQLNWYL